MSVENLIQTDLFEGILPAVSNRLTGLTRGKRAASPPQVIKLPEFRVIRSSRRKRGITAIRQNGLIEIHLPDNISRRQEADLVPEMIALVLRREAKSRRTNEQLSTMANQLLREFLPDFHESPSSIVWRSMRERWGSCTTVDQTIRISDRLASAPEYVINCVLFHELIHLRVADHGPNFRLYLARFPDKDRAEAFLEGFEAGIGALPDSPILY